MKKPVRIIILLLTFLLFCGWVDIVGTYENPIIDSDMSYEQAFEGLSANCPLNIKNRQRLINVKYYSFDNKVHQGQMVIDMDLADDIEFAFEEALKENFLVNSVIPLSHISFRRNGLWDDNLSMEANNTSCFNYRTITGGQIISLHASGRAVDINPLQNPYIKGNILLPVNSNYNPYITGTLTSENIIVRSLLSRGWEWGGNWTSPKDYQHLEKR
ncbi:MAG: M15 family metallopeptidase [Treponema sp.]|jgi:hypothetical protein|nr:M15 family metallopeptidase [Treponema sp.]